MLDYQKITPLIVCGMGRSGTRQFADFMNKHPCINVHGEIARGKSRAFISLLREIEKEFQKLHEKRRRKLTAKKLEILHENWRLLSYSNRPNPKNGILYSGYKTPRHEWFFEDYEHYFDSIHPKPVYFYCARNFSSCWRSYKNMPWNPFKSVEDFADVYIKSYKFFEKMKNEAEDRVYLLNLDSYIRASDTISFLKDHIFDPLDLDLSEETRQDLLNTANSNSSANIVGVNPEEVTDEEKNYIASNWKLQAIHKNYFSFLES